jgi:hypothetical protein
MQQEHPIVEQALHATIEPGTIYADKVKKRLLAIESGEELEHAVLTLVSAAKFAEDCERPDAADKILALAFTAIEPLKRFSASARQLAEDLTRAKTERFAAFTADKNTKLAPKYGVKPSGSVSLFRLLPPRPKRA